MPGEVEDDDVPVLGLVERRLEPSQDVLLRRALIHDDADVVVRTPKTSFSVRRTSATSFTQPLSGGMSGRS